MRSWLTGAPVIQRCPICQGGGVARRRIHRPLKNVAFVVERFAVIVGG
jgi:hypothetical protein